MAEDIKSGTAPKEPEQRAQDNSGATRPTFNYAEVYGDTTETTQQPAQQPPQQQQKPQRGGEDSTGGGSEWSDVT